MSDLPKSEFTSSRKNRIYKLIHMNSNSHLNLRNLIPGFIVGLTCTINAFSISIGSLNLRINDIAFYILIFYWALSPKTIVRHYYSSRIMDGVIIVVMLFIYMVAVRWIHYDEYPPLYQSFFIKYLINKLLWFPLYIAFFMLYGGRTLIIGVLWGIGVSSVLNTVLVIWEYIAIVGGNPLNYDVIKNIGITVADKKLDVFNQGLIRPTGFMIDPNFTGAYAGIGTIWWDYLWNQTRNKKYSIFAIISVLPMFLLFSRTAIFSYLICFIFSVTLNIYRKKKYNIMSSYIIILISISIFFLLSYVLSENQEVIDNISRRTSMSDGSTLARLGYIEYYFSNISFGQLLFGVGMAGSFLTPFFGTTEVLHPESSYIAILMEYGLLFFMVYILLLFFTLKKLLKRNYYFALLFTYLNLIGLSYNFLGDRLYYFLVICFILYIHNSCPNHSRICLK